MKVKMPAMVLIREMRLKRIMTVKITMKNGNTHQFNMLEKVVKSTKKIELTLKKHLLHNEKVVVEVPQAGLDVNLTSIAKKMLRVPGKTLSLVLPREETRRRSLNAEEILMVEVDLRPNEEYEHVELQTMDDEILEVNQAMARLAAVNVTGESLAEVQKRVEALQSASQ